jgi:DNA (cytosine-5)-methyltransferase 1
MWRLIDLFAGCGGLTRGFHDTGRFEAILAVENNRDAAATYEANFGPHVFMGDIADVKTYARADVVVGGPPCQGFSTLNMRGAGFERRALWRYYAAALELAEPSVFVMENVPGLLSSREYAAFRRSIDPAYDVVDGVLDMSRYGVPQRRKRAIVIGSRVGRVSLPPQSHGIGVAPFVTVRDALKGLPIEPDGRNWHVARKPTPLSVERYKTIPNEGENRFDLAQRRPDITPRCWLEKETGSTDVFGRLWWDRPAVTIRTEFFKPEKGRYLHPSAHRPLTVREAARLMTFPDDFVFPTDQSMTSVARQIGNAVPPLFARALAEACSTTLTASDANAA